MSQFHIFPVPAATRRATRHEEDTDDENEITNQTQLLPGTLPLKAMLSRSARGLLMRLLERDPRVRMKSLRQLEQSAFFMGYKFDRVKTMEISPRSLLERCFPNGPPDPSGGTGDGSQHFENFETA